jgi:hypothetical protein
MPSQIVSKRIAPEMGQEIVTLMDDFGTQHLVQIGVQNTPEQRAAILAARRSLLDANETRLATYAAANGHDLSAQRTAGIVARTALQTKNGTAPGTVL